MKGSAIDGCMQPRSQKGRPMRVPKHAQWNQTRDESDWLLATGPMSSQCPSTGLGRSPGNFKLQFRARWSGSFHAATVPPGITHCVGTQVVYVGAWVGVLSVVKFCSAFVSKLLAPAQCAGLWHLEIRLLCDSLYSMLCSSRSDFVSRSSMNDIENVPQAFDSSRRG